MQEIRIFDPEKDSIFGKIFFETITEKQKLNEVLQTWLNSRGNFILSSGVQKQYYCSNLPDTVRKHFSEKNHSALIDTVLLPLREQNCLDITFELIEWIFIGYDEKDLILEILYQLTKNTISFPENMIEKMKKKYNQLFTS